MRRCIVVLLVLAALLLGACAQPSPTPEGNYSAPIIPEVYETAVFCGNTVELCNPRDGTRLYEYEIIEDGTKIQLTSVETGDACTRSFKYIVKTCESGEVREVVIIGDLIYYPE